MSEDAMDQPLRTMILERALERRAAGRSIEAPEPSTPHDAARAAVDQLHDVLASLRADEWDTMTHVDIGTVRDLVTHLLGIERLVLAAVTTDDASIATDHLGSSRAAAADADALEPAALATTWHTAAIRALDACATADAERRVTFSGLPTDVEGLLVLRSFELWAHTLDVCAATGRPPPEVESARLALMSSRLMRVLPGAFVLRAVDPPVARVRFVLTGDGGGCYDVDLGAGESTVTVVADTLDVCRVASRRLAPGALETVIEGDDHAANAVLLVLDAFARD